MQDAQVAPCNTLRPLVLLPLVRLKAQARKERESLLKRMWANANLLLPHTGMAHEWVFDETHEFDMHGTDVVARSKNARSTSA